MNSPISFREILPADAAMLLEWRTRPDITAMMLSDILHGVSEQMAWIKNSYNRPDFYHWIVRFCPQGEAPCDAGYFSLIDFNPQQGSTRCGFYIGPPQLRPRLGVLVFPMIYNFLFFELGLARVFSDPLAHNRSKIATSLYFGFSELPEKRQKLKKGEAEVEALLFELKRETWLARTRHHHCRATFPMALWQAKPFVLESEHA